MSRRPPAGRHQIQTRHQADSLGRNVVSLEGGLAERKTRLYQVKILRQELRDSQVSLLRVRNGLLEEKEEYERDYAMAQEILESLRDDIRSEEAEANSDWAACASLRQRLASLEGTARALRLAKSSFAGASPSASSTSTPGQEASAQTQRPGQRPTPSGSQAVLDLLARLPHQAEAMGKTDLSARKAATLRLQEEAARGEEDIRRMQADIVKWKNKIAPLQKAIEETRKGQEGVARKLERARSEVTDLLLRRRTLQSKLSLVQARRDRVKRVHSQLQDEAEYGRGNIEELQHGAWKELQETSKIFQLSSKALQEALALHEKDTNKVLGSVVAHSRQLEYCQVLPPSADFGSIPTTATTPALAALTASSTGPTPSPQPHVFQEPWRGLGRGREGLSPALPQISSSIIMSSSSAGGWTCPLPSVAAAKPAAKLPKASGSIKVDGQPNPAHMVWLQGGSAATPRMLHSPQQQASDRILSSVMDLPASAR